MNYSRSTTEQKLVALAKEKTFGENFRFLRGRANFQDSYFTKFLIIAAATSTAIAHSRDYLEQNCDDYGFPKLPLIIRSKH